MIFVCHYSSGRQSPTDTKSEKSSLTATTAFSSTTGGTGYGAKHSSGAGARKAAEAFVSLQLEKVSGRVFTETITTEWFYCRVGFSRWFFPFLLVGEDTISLSGLNLNRFSVVFPGVNLWKNNATIVSFQSIAYQSLKNKNYKNELLVSKNRNEKPRIFLIVGYLLSPSGS